MTDDLKGQEPKEDEAPTTSMSGDLGRLLEERERLEQILQKKFQKVITVMFTDLKGSTTLAAEQGNLAARLLIKQLNDIVFPVIGRNSGVLVKTMGDGTLSWFAAAQDAVRAGIHIQAEVDTFNRTKSPNIPIQIRIGMHTGEGLVEKDDIFGDVVNVASRFESQANPGEVYLSEDTFNALTNKSEFDVRYLKNATLRGKKEEFKVFKVLWNSNTAEGVESPPVKEKKVPELSDMLITSDLSVSEIAHDLISLSKQKRLDLLELYCSKKWNLEDKTFQSKSLHIYDDRLVAIRETARKKHLPETSSELRIWLSERLSPERFQDEYHLLEKLEKEEKALASCKDKLNAFHEKEKEIERLIEKCRAEILGVMEKLGEAQQEAIASLRLRLRNVNGSERATIHSRMEQIKQETLAVMEKIGRAGMIFSEDVESYQKGQICET